MTDEMRKYKEAYLSEAHMLVSGMNLALIEWEKHPKSEKWLQDVFRQAHTLKSISAAMRFQMISDLCHAMEDLLDAIRFQKLLLKDCINLLFNCVDFLEASLLKLSEGASELDSKALMQKITDLMHHEQSLSTEEIKVKPNHAIENISAIEVKVERLDKLLNLTKQLLINKMKLETLCLSIQSPELTTTVDVVNRTVKELQYQVMQIRLVPIGFVFGRFIRMVRDLAKHQKKEVRIETEGDAIELDRSLIDIISETLAHLIKNAIDHGLELPKIRQSAKKSSYGIIKLSAKREKDLFIIEVRDDGAGLEISAIKNKAIQRKLISPKAPPEEIVNCIFQGISTSKRVTPVSGRGLGLSIVKQKIESINGSVQVKSVENAGTQFTLTIPLTLAVIFVLLIKQAGHTYAIPLNSIERLMMIPMHEVKGLIRREGMIYQNSNIPVLHLSHLFNLTLSKKRDRYAMVVLRKNSNLIGLHVDELLTTEEIITQPINAMVHGTRLFSGSALLGSGETILILDVEELFSLTK